jgi:pyruvate-ferredoxin/flavodoxin oxidoreductase
MYDYLAKQVPTAGKAASAPVAAPAAGEGCTLTATAEHSGANKPAEPCDDGRAGK